MTSLDEQESIAWALSAAKLRKDMKACEACGLRKTCTQPVPWSGPRSLICFVDEIPREREDFTGLPLAADPYKNNAAHYFNRTLRSLKRRREAIPVCHVLACRPPEDRIPASPKKFLDSCDRWLRRQIALIDPWIMVLLGNTALQAIRPGSKLKDVRGKLFKVDYRVPGGVKTGIQRWAVATWNPNYVFREPTAELEFRKDLETAFQAMDLFRSVRAQSSDPNFMTSVLESILTTTESLKSIPANRKPKNRDLEGQLMIFSENDQQEMEKQERAMKLGIDGVVPE